MTDLHPVTAVAAGVLGLAAGVFVPRLIAWLPEPEPEEPDPAEEDAEPAEPEEPEEPKELNADIGARPGLVWRTALATGVSAAAVGVTVGWHLALLVALPLVPVCVALAVVDWRTRLLPFRLVAPSYAVAIVTILLAWLLGDHALHDLERTALGWLVYGGAFFVLWFVYPPGLGYGDVRLAGVLGLVLGWLGWAQLMAGMLSALALGAVLGTLLSLVTRRRDYPLGPFMLVGALIGVVLGQRLLPGLTG